ncbi:MAG: hypothetical protein K0M69_15725 [Youngiibacter sp.]|nr:hypothetical protein [Youngiibacter sp.]
MDNREWYVCPNCGKRLLQYGSTALSKGLYIKCKNCKEIFEIKLPK